MTASNRASPTRATSRAYGRRAWRNLAAATVRRTPWCMVCGSRTNLRADHKVPPERGGAFLDPHNLQVLCSRCNASKGRSTMDEWMLSAGYKARLAARDGRPVPAGAAVPAGTARPSAPRSMFTRRPRVY